MIFWEKKQMSEAVLWRIQGCDKDTAKVAVSFNNKNVLPSYASSTWLTQNNL